MNLYHTLAELDRQRQAVALCTVVRASGSTPRRSASKMLVYPDGRIEGTIGGGELERRVIAEAQAALKEGRPRLLTYRMNDPQRGDPGVCGGQVEVFVEPLLPPPTLLVVGGGHVGRALVHLGSWLGYHVILTDDRPEFCSPQAAPGADEYLVLAPEEIARQAPLTPHTWVVLVSRSPEVDLAALPGLLQAPRAYIGVIGSRRRWAVTRKQLLEKGLPPEALAEIHAPVGLELNAETPAEIALSIMAEITMLRYGGDGQPMHKQEQRGMLANPQLDI